MNPDILYEMLEQESDASSLLPKSVLLAQTTSLNSVLLQTITSDAEESALAVDNSLASWVDAPDVSISAELPSTELLTLSDIPDTTSAFEPSADENSPSTEGISSNFISLSTTVSAISGFYCGGAFSTISDCYVTGGVSGTVSSLSTTSISIGAATLPSDQNLVVFPSFTPVFTPVLNLEDTPTETETSPVLPDLVINTNTLIPTYTLGETEESYQLTDEGGQIYSRQLNLSIVYADEPAANPEGIEWESIYTTESEIGNAADITGNHLDNVISGNSNTNIIVGGEGNDTLTGGFGGDTFAFASGDGKDMITDFYSDTIQWIDQSSIIRWIDSAGNVVENPYVSYYSPDLIDFSAGANSDQLWFSRESDNLLINTIGTEDSVIVSGWYSSGVSTYAGVIKPTDVKVIKAADGKVLDANEVENLVSAMAAFTPPAAGQTTLSATYQTALSPVFTANWS